MATVCSLAAALCGLHCMQHLVQLLQDWSCIVGGSGGAIWPEGYPMSLIQPMGPGEFDIPALEASA